MWPQPFLFYPVSSCQVWHERDYSPLNSVEYRLKVTWGMVSAYRTDGSAKIRTWILDKFWNSSFCLWRVCNTFSRRSRNMLFNPLTVQVMHKTSWKMQQLLTLEINTCSNKLDLQSSPWWEGSAEPQAKVQSEHQVQVSKPELFLNKLLHKKCFDPTSSEQSPHKDSE